MNTKKDAFDNIAKKTLTFKLVDTKRGYKVIEKGDSFFYLTLITMTSGKPPLTTVGTIACVSLTTLVFTKHAAIFFTVFTMLSIYTSCQ